MGRTSDTLELADVEHRLVRILDLSSIGGSPRRPMIRGCLDWTDRGAHRDGRVGAHLLTVFLKDGWVSGQPSSRALRLTAQGEQTLAQLETR